MQEFEKEHEHMHLTIKEIVQLKAQNETTKAEDKYKDIIKLSDNIVRLLDESEKRINANEWQVRVSAQ
jgi:hypothetical protein